jgi:GGDEF domain-containing protein
LFPNDNDDADILLCHSDQAMYQAKKLGRNQICQYADNS